MLEDIEVSKQVEKTKDVLTNEEIAIRLTETWLSSGIKNIYSVLNAYDIALEHLNKVKGEG